MFGLILNKTLLIGLVLVMTVNRKKIQRHVKAPLRTCEAPSSRFSHVYIDIVGPLTSSSGYTYLFTCINRYTHWPEAIPITDATAESCASAVLSG